MISWIKSLFGSSEVQPQCPVVAEYRTWSEADKLLIMTSSMTVNKLAEVLDRTPNAIRSKRKRLKAMNE